MNAPTQYVLRLALAFTLIGCGNGTTTADSGTNQDGSSNTDSTAQGDGANHSDAATDASPGSFTQLFARECILTASCGNGTTNSDITLCANLGAAFYLFLAASIDPNGVMLQQQSQCIATANSCTAYAHCGSGTYQAAYCTAHPGVKTCDGNTFVDCTAPIAGLPAVRDCAASGETCQMANGTAACTDGNQCAAVDGGSNNRCDGIHIIGCDTATNLETSSNCAALNPALTCAMDPNTTTCVSTTSPTCTGNGSSCDGNVFVGCSVGHQVRVDCSEINSHCAPDPNASDAGPATVTCLPNETACTSSTPSSCTGTHLNFCLFGHIYDQDCTQLGFQTCHMTTPSSGVGVALCGN